MRRLSDTPNSFRYGKALNKPSTSESSHTSWLPTAGKTRPGRPAARICSSGAGSCFKTSSYTNLQYGFSEGVGPCLPHQTMSPVLRMNLARPLWTSCTISRATHSPPCSRNIVRRTPGSSFTSSTDASVIQPLSTVKVVTSLLVSKHDDLNQLIGGWVIGELDILPNDLFRDLLGKNKRKYVDHQLDRFLPLIGLVREVHHRPRVTVHSKRKRSTANPCRLLGDGCPRP